MDIAIIVDGSNSIYPWPPVVAFLKKLLENLDIGPDNTQVSVLTVINVYHLPFVEVIDNASFKGNGGGPPPIRRDLIHG